MRGILFAVFLAGSVQADTPSVVADIAPVHSLVALVMGDIGTPHLLLDAQADPHHAHLRPSQARQLANADIVIWMGETLTPWLPRMIDALRGQVVSIELLDLHDLPLRVPAYGDHAEDQTGGAVDHNGDIDHGHGAEDPHAWLDPENAKRFLLEIANALSAIDPANSGRYRANATLAAAKMDALIADVTIQLAPLDGALLIPYHDAYRYFFQRFGLQVAGSLADSEATSPSVARLSDIRAQLASAARYCVFSEPGGNPKLIRTVLPDDGYTPANLYPLGSNLTPGPSQYENLVRQLAESLARCEAR